MRIDQWKTQTALQLNKPESLIDAVLSHMFSGAQRALNEKVSVELTGLGIFKVVPRAFHNKMMRSLAMEEAYLKQLTNPDLTKTKVNTINRKLETVRGDIEFLKSKMNEKDFKVIRPFTKGDKECPTDSRGDS